MFMLDIMFEIKLIFFKQSNILGTQNRAQITTFDHFYVNEHKTVR